MTSSARSASSCWSRPPGFGARSATTTRTGGFRIDGVTGPDEYSAIADNNVYTNLMAQRNLRAAADARRAPPATAPPSSASTPRRRPAGATPPTAMLDPLRRRRSASIRRPRSSPSTRSGTSQGTPPEQYPLMLHFPYFDLYRKQVVKQADLVLALSPGRRRVHGRGEGPRLRLLRGADGPRLLALRVHPGGGRRRGGPRRARLRLLRRGGAPRPRQTLHHNTRDGVHLASLAGAWIAAVCRFRRDARPPRLAQLRPTASAGARPPGLPRLLQGAAHQGRGRARARRATRCSRASRSTSATTGTP